MSILLFFLGHRSWSVVGDPLLVVRACVCVNMCASVCVCVRVRERCGHFVLSGELPRRVSSCVPSGSRVSPSCGRPGVRLEGRRHVRTCPTWFCVRKLVSDCVTTTQRRINGVRPEQSCSSRSLIACYNMLRYALIAAF